MPRGPRLLLEDRPTVYHVISRTALPGFPMGAVEKDYLLSCIKHYAAIFFVEVMGFSLMGNHFHLLVRMDVAENIQLEDVIERYKQLFGADAILSDQRLDVLRQEWCSLSKFISSVKQRFSRYYNKKHGRKGYFWGDRFKSVIVEDGRTLINCLAYVDCNPVRAGLTKRPEDYRWCSLGYHLQTYNKDDLLSLDFGLADWDIDDVRERLRLYREFLYENAALERNGGKLPQHMLERARENNFEYTTVERLMLRSRYFTESVILGSLRFVEETGQRLGLLVWQSHYPIKVSGLDTTYAFRMLREL